MSNLIKPQTLKGFRDYLPGPMLAREALIENAIAQTATIPLANGPTFTARYDGAPRFAPIDGTSLSYAVNAPVPVIQAAPDAYYAVKAGVWFTATAATGPWTIAKSVPDAIYTIPPSSRVFFATFVRIYDATADHVFAGYTPGYLGAMRGSAGTVVYGTGYAYAPYLGAVWVPGPATYGVAAAPVYNRYVGYTYGFSMGLATPGFGTTKGAHWAEFVAKFPYNLHASVCSTDYASVFAQAVQVIDNSCDQYVPPIQ